MALACHDFVTSAEEGNATPRLPRNPAELVERALTGVFDWSRDKGRLKCTQSEAFDGLSTVAAFTLVGGGEDVRTSVSRSDARRALSHRPMSLDADAADRLLAALAQASGG